MKHLVLHVDNIKCGGCQNTIRKELLHQPGVMAVHIDEDNATVHISGDDEMDREHLVSRLDHLGYPESGNNDLLKKAKSYVSCAVGRMSSDKN